MVVALSLSASVGHFAHGCHWIMEDMKPCCTHCCASCCRPAEFASAQQAAAAALEDDLPPGSSSSEDEAGDGDPAAGGRQAPACSSQGGAGHGVDGDGAGCGLAGCPCSCASIVPRDMCTWVGLLTGTCSNLGLQAAHGADAHTRSTCLAILLRAQSVLAWSAAALRAGGWLMHTPSTVAVRWEPYPLSHDLSSDTLCCWCCRSSGWSEQHAATSRRGHRL